MIGVNVIEADLASPEEEAQEAAELVAALEFAVSAGCDATPTQIAAQESLSRFARVRAEKTRRAADLSRSARHSKRNELLT